MSVTRCLSMLQQRVSFDGLPQEEGSPAGKTMRLTGEEDCGARTERNDPTLSLG